MIGTCIHPLGSFDVVRRQSVGAQFYHVGYDAGLVYVLDVTCEPCLTFNWHLVSIFATVLFVTYLLVVFCLTCVGGSFGLLKSGFDDPGGVGGFTMSVWCPLFVLALCL